MLSEANVVRYADCIFQVLKYTTVIEFSQMPKNYFDKEFLEYVRRFGVYGSRPGHMGRSTHFYSLVNLPRISINNVWVSGHY